MLAKGYSFSCMEMKKTEFLSGTGRNKISDGKGDRREEKQERERGNLWKNKEKLCAQRRALSQVDWQAGHYDFRGSSGSGSGGKGAEKDCKKRIEEIRKKS